ncbi:TPA: ABC transporter ATP-binding protein [Streptococcus suis]
MLKLFKKFNSKEWLMFTIALAFILFQVWLDLKLPTYMAEITKKIITPGTQMNELTYPGSMMVVLSILSLVASLVVGYIAAYLGAAFSRTLRRDVFNKVLSFSPAESRLFSVPSLVTRTTNDISQIQLLIAMGMQVVIKGPITAVWAIIKIADKSAGWLMATGAAVIFMLLMIAIILSLAVPKQAMIQSLTDRLNAVSRENISGVRVIRAYNAEQYRQATFEQANTSLTDTQLYSTRLFSLFQPLMITVINGLNLAVYWIGAYIVDSATMLEKVDRFADMTVFTSYAMQVVFSFMMMTMIFMFLPRALVASKRINEVLDKPVSIQFPQTNLGQIDASQPAVAFENVTFKYTDAAEPVIADINFKAYPGQTVAFIGSTGSGKSTLVNLIPRFYDVSQGTIRLFGQDLASFDQSSLNTMVGYIPQKPVIFSGTIASNLDFGASPSSPLTNDQMTEAIAIAQASEFVQSKENGLDSVVSQNGGNLSGGQKQRLAIARALARKPEILIFDDSFSALDYRTDKALRQALKDKTKGLTKLIVAQRISTIMDADLIVVLDQGRIVGQGTHQELLQTNAVYQEIAHSQLSEEELANG